jgi:hypothetical protein
MNEKFDFEEEPRANRSGPQAIIWDMLTALTLLITLGLGLFFGYLFLNPTTSLNPFQPHPPTPFLFPTATITPIQFDSTWTPTFVVVTDMPTLVPSITLQPSSTPINLIPPTKTPKPTATPQAPFSSTVSAIASTIIHPDAGCAWFGIGGTVVDASNAPIVGMVLRLTGGLNGQLIDTKTVSGVAPAYGQSGFEIALGTTPVDSSKLLTLQLLDQAGLPLANNVYIVTYSDCKKNLILVRFKKNQ